MKCVLKPGRLPGTPGFVAREVAAYALHGVLGPFARRASPEPASGRAVLFVHGHGGGPGAFMLLERALRRRGFERFLSFSYRSSGSVPALAEELERHVHGAGEGDLHVVGHSLGGILARTWLQELGGRARARSFTTLSSPHQGLAAGVARALPVVRELVLGSPLLRRLEEGAAALDGLPCLSIVSSRDHFVRPWQKAAFANARVVPVAHAGHVGVLFSERVADLVAGHLDEADAATKGD